VVEGGETHRVAMGGTIGDVEVEFDSLDYDHLGGATEVISRPNGKEEKKQDVKGN